MRAKFQTKVALTITIDDVVVKFHSHKIPIGVTVEIVEHDTAKCAILHLKNDVVGDRAVAAAAIN